MILMNIAKKEAVLSIGQNGFPIIFQVTAF